MARHLCVEVLAELRRIFPSAYHTMETQGRKQEYAQEVLINICQQRILNRSMLDIALRTAREYSQTNNFMPAPAMFVSWAKPSLDDHGIPEPVLALQLAADQAGRHPDFRKWPHPVVEATAVAYGFLNLKQLTDRQSPKRWCELYGEQCKAFLAGEALKLTPRPERIEHDKEYSREAAERENARFMSDFNSIFGGGDE